MAFFTPAFLKMLLPHLLTLASGIVPMFASKKSNGSSESTPDPGHAHAISTLQAQVIELQTALTTQGQALQSLSKELSDSFTAIATSLEAHESRLKQQRLLSFAALGLGVLAVILAFVFKRV